MVRLCLCALILSLAAATPAAAGPVFAIVADDGATPLAGRAALEGELAADQAALARAAAAERHARAKLEHLRQRLRSTALLSAQLDAAPAASQLGSIAGVSGKAVTRLEARISELHAALAGARPLVEAAAVRDSSLGARAVSIAEQYLGVPYVWGGADPSTGFDCSGLVKYVYGRLGIDLTHYAAAQYAETQPIDPAALEPGDLVFFHPQWNGPGHVGIYVGGDAFIEAPHTGDVVKLASLSEEARQAGFVGATRPV